VGSLGLLAGLLLIGATVTLELVESFMAREEIWDEISDLDEETTRLVALTTARVARRAGVTSPRGAWPARCRRSW